MNVLIVLSGSPPSQTLLKTEMSESDLVLAVDGGYNVFMQYGLAPDVILGDMDSIESAIPANVKCVTLPDQDSTDLQKTMTYVQNEISVSSLVLLGAGGGRTDHLMHNLLIAGSLADSIKITIKNELHAVDLPCFEVIQRITPACVFDLRVRLGDLLSILPIGGYQGLSSTGLEWEIENQDLSDGFISQSNRARVDDPRFEITSGNAYIAVYQ